MPTFNGPVETTTINGNLTLQDDGTGNYGVFTANVVAATTLVTGPQFTPGTDITTALQAAINALPSGGGIIELPAGSFTISALLKPVTGLRLLGQGANVTKLVSASGGIFDIGNASTDSVEFAAMTLDATGGDIFGGSTVNCIRWYVHDCIFHQRSAGNSIWNGTIPSTTGVMIECAFRRNQHHAHGATRTVEAWTMTGSSGANAINQNSWADEVCFNDDNDASEYFFHVTATTQSNAANTWRNIVFEHAYGGMILLESHDGGEIDTCLAWDVNAVNVANHLVQVKKSSGGGNSQSNVIVNSPRNGAVTFAANIKDIVLDANCPQTTIVAPRPAKSTTLLVDGGGSNPLVIGSPSSFTFTNASGVLLPAKGSMTLSTDASGGTFKPVLPNGRGDLFRAPAGATGETVTRQALTVVNQAPAVSGTVYLVAIILPAGITVNNISMVTGTGTLKTGGTHGWYVLADSGLVVRAATADQTDAATVWGTASTKYTLATNAYVTTYSGLYYVGIMVANTSGTQPNLVTATAMAAGVTGLPPVLSGPSTGATGTAQTTPPATDGSVTLGAISSPDAAKCFYAFTS